MLSQQSTIVNAIQDLGGISPAKIKKCGTWTEWYELPQGLRLRIFRNASTSGPDDMASQLQEFGIHSESDLLCYLKDPIKVRMNSDEIRDYDILLAELQATRKELEKFTRPYEIRFVEIAGRFVPYHVPVTDVPF